MQHIFLRQKDANVKVAFKFKAVVPTRGGSPVNVKDYRKSLNTAKGGKRKRSRKSRKHIELDPDSEADGEERDDTGGQDVDRGEDDFEQDAGDYHGDQYTPDDEDDLGEDDTSGGKSVGRVREQSDDQDLSADDNEPSHSPKRRAGAASGRQPRNALRGNRLDSGRSLANSAPRRMPIGANGAPLALRSKKRPREEGDEPERLEVPLSKTGPPRRQKKSKSSSQPDHSPAQEVPARNNDDEPVGENVMTNGQAPPKMQRKAPSNKRKAGEDPADMIGEPTDRITRNKVLRVR